MSCLIIYLRITLIISFFFFMGGRRPQPPERFVAEVNEIII